MDGHRYRRARVAGVVSEQQMAALFGEGLHPNAEAIITARIEAGDDPRAAVAAARLGRKHPVYRNETPFAAALRVAVGEHREDTGRAPSDEQRLAIRRRVARTVMRHADRVAGRSPGDDGPDVRQVDRFLSAERRRERQPVAGFDLVFTPVKSASVLWAVGDHDTPHRRGGRARRGGGYRDHNPAGACGVHPDRGG